jgi:Mg2+ and Co2+ transporter CorA
MTGVLLLDPSIKAGTPLWYGYRNWESTPSYKIDKIPIPPPRNTLFNDFVYWAQRPDNFSSQIASGATSNAHLPIATLLRLICGEWLTMGEYVKTRLTQIEWEISVPGHFLKIGATHEDSLKKLHTWRRLVPFYRHLLDETIEQVSRLSWPTQVPRADRKVSSPPTQNTGPFIQTANLVNDPVSAFKAEFARALSYMKEHQAQIDGLCSVVPAVISIEDSKHAQNDNRNLARLTWLGTFFLPLSFIASFFSMQSDIGSLAKTYILYAEVAIPIAVVVSCGLLAFPRLQALFGR